MVHPMEIERLLAAVFIMFLYKSLYIELSRVGTIGVGDGV